MTTVVLLGLTTLLMGGAWISWLDRLDESARRQAPQIKTSSIRQPVIARTIGTGFSRRDRLGYRRYYTTRESKDRFRGLGWICSELAKAIERQLQLRLAPNPTKGLP